MRTKITTAEWTDSQNHERDYWKAQATAGNQEQYHRWGWYRHVCFPDYFAAKSFVGLSLADVGSGPEGILHYIEGASHRVAIDPLMTDYINAGYHVSKGGVMPVTAKAEDLRKVKDRFDVVFCLNCLDHCIDPAKAIAQIASIIKPGGELVICVDMRFDADLDALHKIKITSDFMDRELTANGITFTRWEVPHQQPTRTIQYCATGVKQ